MTGAELTWAFQDWLRTRPYGRLWRSLPAILVGCCGLAFLLWVAGWRHRSIRTDYTRIAHQALAKRNYRTARIACERLLAFGSDSRADNLLYLSQAMKGLGQEPESAALLRLAAPLDRPGSLPAHLMVARTCLGATNLGPQHVALAEIHLKHALVLEPGSAEANELLGRIYMQRREWDLAKDQFLRVITTNPKVLLLLAVVSREAGDEAGARGWAERAVKFYRDRLDKSRADNPVDRSLWAQGLLLSEKYAEALKVLEDGQKLSGKRVYDAALADLCFAWAQALARSEPRNVAQRIRLLKQGLEAAPDHVKLLQLLVNLSHLEGSEAEEARAIILGMMGQGGSSAMLHFVLGNDAWTCGDIERAGKHFHLAFALSPRVPEIANNMATFLALKKDPDLARALTIVESLLAQSPNDPFFRDTRGQILVRLNRWTDAIKDLEFALPRLPTKGLTHAALGTAYRELGMAELAAEHERLAGAAGKPRPPANPSMPPTR